MRNWKSAARELEEVETRGVIIKYSIIYSDDERETPVMVCNLRDGQVRKLHTHEPIPNDNTETFHTTQKIIVSKEAFLSFFILSKFFAHPIKFYCVF